MLLDIKSRTFTNRLSRFVSITVASAKQIILDKGALLYKRMSGKIISMKY
jgi:hypothetical protein